MGSPHALIIFKTFSGLVWGGRILQTFFKINILSVMRPPFKRVLSGQAGEAEAAKTIYRVFMMPSEILME